MTNPFPDPLHPLLFNSYKDERINPISEGSSRFIQAKFNNMIPLAGDLSRNSDLSQLAQGIPLTSKAGLGIGIWHILV